MAGGGSDTIVVKCGGSPLLHRAALVGNVADLVGEGRRVVLVHGGGPEADRLMRELGRTPKHVVTPSGASSRRTDAEALDALTMAFTGRVKPTLVDQLDRAGVPAVGLTGLDGGLVEARQKPALKILDEGRTRLLRDDLSGRVTSVRPALLELLCASGYVPVVSPPVRGDGETPLNVDADRLAANLAAALDAQALVLLTDAPGVLRDPDDPATLVPSAESHEDLLDYARGRMKLKVVAAGEALVGGVATVAISDGRRASPVDAALTGEGTLGLKPRSIPPGACCERPNRHGDRRLFESVAIGARTRGRPVNDPSPLPLLESMLACSSPASGQEGPLAALMANEYRSWASTPPSTNAGTSWGRWAIREGPGSCSSATSTRCRARCRCAATGIFSSAAGPSTPRDRLPRWCSRPHPRPRPGSRHASWWSASSKRRSPAPTRRPSPGRDAAASRCPARRRAERLDGVGIAYKGRTGVTLDVRRPPAHTSAPAERAVEAAVGVWQAVRDYLDGLPVQGDGDFDRPIAALTRIDGDIVRAKAEIVCRVPPGFDFEDFERHLDHLTAGEPTRLDERTAAVEQDRRDPVSHPLRRDPPRGRPSAAEAQVRDVRHEHLRAGMEGSRRRLRAGDSALDHTDHEHVSITELDRGVGVLADTLASLPEVLAAAREANAVEADPVAG